MEITLNDKTEINEHQETPLSAKAEIDLAVCPPEILALDPNAEILWPLFVRKTGVATSAARKRKIQDFWVDNNSHRAAIIRNFGIPSLIQRLAVVKTEIERARIWWREAAACSAGDMVPDLSAENRHVLNTFIVTKELRYSSSQPSMTEITENEFSDVANPKVRASSSFQKRMRQAQKMRARSKAA